MRVLREHARRFAFAFLTLSEARGGRCCTCTCSKKKGYKGHDGRRLTTTTTTTNHHHHHFITMMTTTTNTNTTITAQQQRLRDRWGNRVTDALFRRMKRNVLAANALFGTPAWVEPEMRYFTPTEELEVTRHAALVEECLDDARTHAKSKGRALPPLEYLPRAILESEALEPYLKRWKRNNAAAAAAAAAAPTRARCAYYLMD